MKYTCNHDKSTHISVVCDMTLLRFLRLLHDILLILFVSRQVVVSKSHFVNQFFSFLGLTIFRMKKEVANFVSALARHCRFNC